MKRLREDTCPRSNRIRRIPEAAWPPLSRPSTPSRLALRPDAVAGNHGDSGRRAAISQRNAGQSLASSTAGLAPSTDLRGLNRPGAILPPKWSARQLYQVLRQISQARSSLRTVSLSMRSNRGSNPMPGPAGTRIVPCADTVTSGRIMSSSQ